VSLADVGVRAPREGTSTVYRRLAVLATCTFAVGVDSFVFAGILPPIAASTGVGVATAGQLITAYALAYALLTPVMATLTAAWQRRRVLLTGLAIFVVGNAAPVVLPWFGPLLAGRVVAGLGGAMVTPVAIATAAAIAPERLRGRALSMVMAGLSAATALGAPVGTVLAAAGGWRLTLGFVAVLGLVAATGVAASMPATALPPPLGLRERLAPAADRRVALTLTTALCAFAGLYTVYTYVSAVLDRATGGSSTTLAGLLMVWGLAATGGNLFAGALTDRYGPRPVIAACILAAAVNFMVLPFTSRHLVTALLALAVWGASGWGILVPNVHRLLGIEPMQAPLLNALHSTAVYLAASASGVIGAAGLAVTGVSGLGPLGAVLLVAGLVFGERAHAAIHRGSSTVTAASGR
jgi:predicted MFS family arabinose efflux permease